MKRRTDTVAAAAKLREDIKASRSRDHQAELDGAIAGARALCGNDAAAEEAWRAGRSATFESAVEFALRAAAR